MTNYKIFGDHSARVFSLYKLKSICSIFMVVVVSAYIFCILNYLFTANYINFTDSTTTPSSVCPSDIPLTHDATKNHLLKFYGHRDLLGRPDVFQAREEILTPLNYSFTLDSPDACPHGSKPVLLIMVLTQHENMLQRKAIRETWGSVAKGRSWPGRRLSGDVRMIFLLGQSDNETLESQVEQEALMTNDIVEADFQESYFNLTLKVLMGFKWAKEYCSGAQYIMKTDEDTFIDVPRVLNILSSLRFSNAIFGPFAYAEKVVRPINGKKHKAAVNLDSYPLDWYPPHVKGNMYIMPANLGSKIVNISQYFPYVNIEDAHITGILAKVFDARHVDIPEDLYERQPKRDLNLCDFVLESRIISQGVYPALAYSFWNRIHNSELCGVISVQSVLKDFSNRGDIVRGMHVIRPSIKERSIRQNHVFT